MHHSVETELQCYQTPPGILESFQLVLVIVAWTRTNASRAKMIVTHIQFVAIQLGHFFVHVNQGSTNAKATATILTSVYDMI